MPQPHSGDPVHRRREPNIRLRHERAQPERLRDLRKYFIIIFFSRTHRYLTFVYRVCFAQSNLTHLPRHEYVPGVGLGTAKCPYDPLDNSTAIWSEKGNPGQLPALYSGTNAEFTKADTVIFRTDLFNLTTGRKEFAFKRTLKYDSNWLDSKYTRLESISYLYFRAYHGRTCPGIKLEKSVRDIRPGRRKKCPSKERVSKRGSFDDG